MQRSVRALRPAARLSVSQRGYSPEDMPRHKAPPFSVQLQAGADSTNHKVSTAQASLQTPVGEWFDVHE